MRGEVERLYGSDLSRAGHERKSALLRSTGRPGWASVAIAIVVGTIFTVSWASGVAVAADGDELWQTIVAGARFQSTISDGAGGAYVAWGSEPGISVQHLDASGVPQWGPSGVQLSSTGLGIPALAGDSLFGVVTVAWQEAGGIYVERVNSAGNVQWNLSGAGVQVSTLGEAPLVEHTAGATPFDPPGAMIAWGEAVRVAAVDANGNVTAPGVNGISLGSSVRIPGYMRMLPDAAGGVIVVWADLAKDIVAQRVNAGLPWGTTPTVISADVRDEGPLDAVPDGSGGALVSWRASQIFPANAQIRVQRIDSTGTSLWAPNGLVVVDSAVVGGNQNAWVQFELDSSVASDGVGGAIVAWNDWRNEAASGGNDDVFAQRVDAIGATRWTANGVLLPPIISGPTAPGSQRGPVVAPDGAGGALVAYQDLGGNSWDISTTRLDSSGNKIFSFFAVSDFNQGDASQIWPHIALDRSGPSPTGAILTWTDQRAGNEIRALKMEISEPPNDVAADAEPVGVLTDLTATLLGSTSDGTSTCNASGTRDVWYRFTAPAWPGTLEVDTCGSNDKGGVDGGIDTVISIHSAAPGTIANELACNDDWPTGSLPTSCLASDAGAFRDSATGTPLVGGQSAWIRVSHYVSSAPGPFDLRVRYALPEPGIGSLLIAGCAGLVALTRRRLHWGGSV